MRIEPEIRLFNHSGGEKSPVEELAISKKTTVEAGGLTVTAGGITVTAGGFTVTAGGLTITAGGLTVSAGATSFTGGVTVVDVGLTVTAGGLTVTAGGITVSAGASSFTGGLTIVDVGLTVTAGGAVITAGDLTLTAGNIFVNGADVDVTGTVQVVQAASDVGVGGRLRHKQLVFSIVGGGITETLTNFIPANTYVMAMHGKIKTTVTGTTIATFLLGVTGDTNRYGNFAALTQNTLVEPSEAQAEAAGTGRWYNAATDVLLTGNAGTFDAVGVVTIDMYYFELKPVTNY